MMRNLIFSFCLLFVSFFCYSQESQDSSKGRLRVITQSSTAIIYVDQIKVRYGEIVTVDTGQHVITAWAPKRKKTRELVRLGNNYIKTFRIKMPFTEEYKKYRNDKLLYNVKKSALKYGPMAAYIYFALGEFTDISNSNDKADSFLKRANENKFNAETSFWPRDIESNRLDFEFNKLKYENEIDNINKSWQGVYIGLAATTVVNYFTWKLAKKMTQPKYTEKPQLSKLFIGPDRQFQTAQLTIGFNF